MRGRTYAGDRPAVSLVIVWRGEGRDLDRRLHGLLTGLREDVELVLVRTCSHPERLRLERTYPGVRIVGASEERLEALRRLGTITARGDVVVIFDDATAEAHSWRDRLPACFLSTTPPIEQAIDIPVQAAANTAVPMSGGAPRPAAATAD